MSNLTQKSLFWISKPVVKTYTDAMLKMDVHQKSAFAAGAKIIAPNHPSTTDPFFVAAMLGHQSYIMIKDVLFNVPVLGNISSAPVTSKLPRGKGRKPLTWRWNTWQLDTPS